MIKPYLTVDNLTNKEVGLNVQGLRKVYKSRLALMDFNISVTRGEVVSLLGPNGAGKSSLIKLISGDTNPTRGTIFYDNFDLKMLSLELRAEIRAVMSQSQLVSFDYTVREIIEMGWIEKGIKNIESEFKKSVIEVSDKCNIKSFLKRKFNTLSGGEQKRVHFARTLLQIWYPFKESSNRYLILDEPLNNLDLYQEVKTMEIIKEMSKKNKFGVILIIHDLNLAAKYSDYLAVLLKGQLRYYGKPKNVLTTNKILEIYGLRMKVNTNPLQINYT